MPGSSAVEPDLTGGSAKLQTLPRQEVDDTMEELDLELEKVSTPSIQQFRDSINTRESCFRVRVIGNIYDVHRFHSMLRVK